MTGDVGNHSVRCRCAGCRPLDAGIDLALDQMRIGLRVRKARREAVRAAALRTGRHPYERESETVEGNSAARRMK